ncbi:MAG: hypothetical protein JWM18_4114 [Chloroflexi bacterium]|nr:hypothetical protein [Chloroflexota bacterium]
MPPPLVAALAALVSLSAPPVVLVARLVHDHRRARRPLPRRAWLARVALALNRERAATPAQCRVAELRGRLYEDRRWARAVLAGHDDLHAGWLLGDAERLARRLDDELRRLWPVADAAPEQLERAARLVHGTRHSLDRLREGLLLRAGEDADEGVADLARGVELERAARMRAAAMLHRGGGLSSPPCDIAERASPADGHILTPGGPAPEIRE